MKFKPLKRIRLPLDVYNQELTVFATISTADRRKWFFEFPELATDAAAILAETCLERTSLLFAWCIMPDHIHLLISDKDIISFIRAFKGRLTPRARAICPGKKLWQRSFYEHVLRGTESAMDVAGYIYENPVRCGLVTLPHEYPFVGSGVWPDWSKSYS